MQYKVHGSHKDGGWIATYENCSHVSTDSVGNLFVYDSTGFTVAVHAFGCWDYVHKTKEGDDD